MYCIVPPPAPITSFLSLYPVLYLTNSLQIPTLIYISIFTTRHSYIFTIMSLSTPSTRTRTRTRTEYTDHLPPSTAKKKLKVQVQEQEQDDRPDSDSELESGSTKHKLTNQSLDSSFNSDSHLHLHTLYTRALSPLTCSPTRTTTPSTTYPINVPGSSSTIESTSTTTTTTTTAIADTIPTDYALVEIDMEVGHHTMDNNYVSRLSAC